MSRTNDARIILIRLDFMEINRHNYTVEDRLTVRPAAIDSATGIIIKEIDSLFISNIIHCCPS